MGGTAVGTALPAAAAPQPPTAGQWELVRESNLTNADGSWNWDFMSHGGHEFDAEAGAWRLGRAGWGGIVDTNDGAWHFPTVAGGTYSFATYLRAASPEFAGAQVNLGAYPGGHISNINLSEEWTLLEGTATATQDGQRFRLTSDVEGLEVLVAGASMFRLVPEETGEPEITEPEEAVEWELVRRSNLGTEGNWSWDIMSHAGHTFVELPDGTTAWQLGRVDWSGIFDTNDGASHFPMTAGGEYRLEAQIRAASDEFDGAQINLSGYPGDHVGNVNISADEWTTLTGELTATADNQRFRVTSDVADLQLLVGEVAVYRNAATTPAPEVTTPAPEGIVVFHRDFEDGQIAGGDGGEFAVVDNPLGDGLVQRISTADSWHGLQIPADVFEPGATYHFQADVLRPADSGAMNARFEGANSPWPWVVGNHAISDSQWSTISGEFTWDENAPMPVRLVNGGDGVFYADNVTVTRLNSGEVAPGFEPIVVRTWDFETMADLGSFVGVGGASFDRVADLDAANGWALRVNVGSEDWQTARLTAPTSNLGEYRLDVTLRLADVAAGEFQARAYPGFTYMGNQAITGEYTTVSTGTLATLGEQIIALHVVPAGADFFIDQIDLVQVTAPPEIDENFEFSRLEWDFEDGTAQGWFGRTAGDGFGVVSPGADSEYAIGVWDRTDQGSGPMFDIDQLVQPGQRLEFSADVRFTEPVSDNRLTLSIQNGPSSFTNLVQNLEIDANGEWTHVSGAFVVPAFTTMARLYLESPWAQGAQGETAAFQVDNIVIDVPAPLEWERDLVPLQATLPGINTGVAVDSRDLIDEMGEVINHHFSHLVGENHMKPDAWWGVGTGAGVNWADGIASFRIHPEARSILDFAQANNQTVFHHVMIWHSQVPDWFFTGDNSTQEFAPTAANQQEMVRRIWEYTETVASGIAAEYGLFGSASNPVNSIEVANEVVHGGGAGAAATHNLRPNSPWTRIFAPVEDSPWVQAGHNNRDWFLYEAFQAADYYFNYVYHVGDARGRHSGDDRLTLWINDYNTERGLVSPDNPLTKRYQLLQVTNRLLEAGAPVDGVGHQFHASLIHPVQGLRHALDLFAFENGFVAKPVLQAVTEIDVTIPSNSEANLIAQGHYYREAFDIIRSHQMNHGDIDTVTIWGLNDSRSWRADQFPLLFNDDLTAKPAFFGAVYNGDWLTGDEGNLWGPEEGGWDRPVLPPIEAHANAFAEAIPMTDAAFAHSAWDALPAHRLVGPVANPGSFNLRWSPDALFVLVDVPLSDITPAGLAAGGGEPGRNFDTRVRVAFEDREVTVRLAGVETEVPGVDVITFDNGSSFRAVIRFALDGVQAGDTASLDLFTYNGTDTPYIGGIQASNAERGAWTSRGPGARGQITFDQPMAFVAIPAADAAPVLGDFDAAVWNSAATLATDVHQSGSADGARANARALWYDTGDFLRLVMAIDVADVTPAGDDSVEVFLGLGDRAADGGRLELYDAQFQISRAGVESFVGGLGWANPQRINSVVVDNGADGYRVMVAIDLRTGTGHQVGQWTNNPLNDARVQAFDLQVNDAGNSVFAWANHTTLGSSLTTHWGAMQLVDTIPAPVDPVDPPVVEPELPSYPEFDGWDTYQPGDRVVIDGRVFQAAWTTSGQVPNFADPHGPWQEIGAPVQVGDQVVETWTASRIYNAGDRAYLNGRIWEAQWWSRNQNPETTNHGPWRIVADNTVAEGAFPAWSATALYTGGELVSHNGQTFRARWWNQGVEPNVNNMFGPWELVIN